MRELIGTPTLHGAKNSLVRRGGQALSKAKSRDRPMRLGEFLPTCVF